MKVVRGSRTTERNIEIVARLERRFLDERTVVERIGDVIGTFAGSMWFVLLHVVWFAAWFIINTGHAGIKPFDPYPFIFLSMAVSVEAVLLSTFVLMKQNRMSLRSDQRNELNLQVDLLAEKEITKVLQLLQHICERLGIEEIKNDEEAKALSEETAVEQIAEERKEKLPTRE